MSHPPTSRPPILPGQEIPPAQVPTMYFFGVTTHQSSIMRVFPRWAEFLGLSDVLLQGVNFPRHADPENYRKAVGFIKHDPLSRGALVTTHKVDLLQACREQFDQLDKHAALMREVSSLSKRGGQLWGTAKDPVTSGLALKAILGDDYWSRTGAEVLICGAGGSSVAVTWYLLQGEHSANRPTRITVTNRSTSRLDEIRRLHHEMGARIPIDYRHTPTAAETDPLVSRLPPYSLVINATGLGKDEPGSPVTHRAEWPDHGIAWDFNYRGDLKFLDEARRQSAAKQLRIEDGWIYFIHGWTSVIAEVFQIQIPSQGEVFDELSRIAAAERTTIP